MAHESFRVCYVCFIKIRRRKCWSINLGAVTTGEQNNAANVAELRSLMLQQMFESTAKVFYENRSPHSKKMKFEECKQDSKRTCTISTCLQVG